MHVTEWFPCILCAEQDSAKGAAAFAGTLATFIDSGVTLATLCVRAVLLSPLLLLLLLRVRALLLVLLTLPLVMALAVATVEELTAWAATLLLLLLLLLLPPLLTRVFSVVEVFVLSETTCFAITPNFDCSSCWESSSLRRNIGTLCAQTTRTTPLEGTGGGSLTTKRSRALPRGALSHTCTL
jgi:hypothetical protein